MAVTAKRARELALALEHSSEAPHFDRAAFRTPKRIFATLARSGTDVNLKLDPPTQREICERYPEAFMPVAGGWGRMGFTACTLSAVSLAAFKEALRAAHALAGLSRPTTRSKAGAKAKAQRPGPPGTSGNKPRGSR